MALLDTAESVLNGCSKVWLTAPEIVREAMKMNISTMSNQSVRNLRQALSSNALKPGSRFVRREIKSSVCFALQKKCEPQVGDVSKAAAATGSNKVGRPRKPKTQQQNIKQQRAAQHQQPLENQRFQQYQESPAVIQAYYDHTPKPVLVEIDPASSPLTPTRPPSTICLPSPSMSILGGKRTLQARAELDHNQERKGRKRTAEESFGSNPVSLMNGFVREAPIPSAYSPSIGAEVVFMETCHTFSSPGFDVHCVRPISSFHQPDAGTDEDPCSAQGDRSHYAPYEVEPKPPRKRKKQAEVECTTSTAVKSGSSSENPVVSAMQIESSSSSSESDAESDVSSEVPLHSRPSSQLLVKRPSQMKVTSASEDQEEPICEAKGTKGEWKKKIKEEDEEGMGGGSESTLASDMDQDYVESRANLRRSREVVKRRVKKMRQMATAASSTGTVKTGKAAAAEGRAGVAKAAADKKGANQKRNISLLFQPQSPLVNENLKNFINMESFSAFTDAQKAKLVKLLPTVDRTGPTTIKESSLTNSFFSSALREWTDMVALGAFTAEHKAKLRAEERKKANRQDNSWKAKFFEDSWGSKQDSEDANKLLSNDDIPYYPQQNLPPHLKACLDTILRACNREDLASPPLSPVKTPELNENSSTETLTAPSSLPLTSTQSKKLSSPVRTATSSPVKATLSSPSRTAAASPVRTAASSVRTTSASPVRAATSSVRTATSSVRTTTSSVRTSTLSIRTAPSSVRTTTPTSVHTPTSSTASSPARVTSPDSPITSSSLAPTSSKVKKMSKIATKPTKSSKPIPVSSPASKLSSNQLQQKRGNLSVKSTAKAVPSQYLSHLPPSTRFDAILETLSKSSKATEFENVKPPVHDTMEGLTPPTHSVYLDHFSTLAADHVPMEFSSPVKSLVVNLPLSVYKSHRTSRQIKLEHSYIKARRSKKEWKKKLNLKLSVPRSILEKANCYCSTKPLVLCSRCQSWYHSNCNTRTVCQSCFSLTK